MEVVAATPNNGGVPPFHDHDVREWSRIDSLTGVLERATLETDNWSTNTNRYNKVVDSRARRDADGSLQQQARRQLEVFQSQIPGGHLQVIKTHTVSSSKWTNKGSIINSSSTNNKQLKSSNHNDFEDLKLSINSLDLSSEKSKASVGRSVSRRPPSRQQRGGTSTTNGFEDPTGFHLNTPLWDIHRTAATNLHRVSRLCHQIHESAVKQAFGIPPRRPSIADSNNSVGSSGAGVEIVDITSNHSESDIVVKSESNSSIRQSSDSLKSFDLLRNHSENSFQNGHSSLLRTKSTSSEDVPYLINKSDSTKSVEDLEDLEQLQSWRRSSKIRRSLQFPKSKPIIDLPSESNVNVRKIREELEKGRRLSTALRNNTVDLEALDQILQSVSNSSSEKSIDDSLEESFNDKKKRNSFITVESLNEVKSRLRRTSSASLLKEDEETDDGIVTEDTKMPNQSKVRSYIYGMEMMNGKNGFGSNSLESRSNLKSEDWYNRRKSYGFEKMNQEESKSIFDNYIESSTDSGICQSSEIVVVPTTRLDSDSSASGDELRNRNSMGNVKKMANLFDSDTKLNSTTIKIPISKNNNVVNLFRDSDNVNGDESSDGFFFSSDDRKTKKVEFCKTEVHFAADSGKVNIVETDEKPPPTNNFRRRRRNSGPTLFNPDFNKNGLPVLHFGDSSYEKTMFGMNDLEEDIYENSNPSLGVVTVNTNKSFMENEDIKKYSEDFDNIKGILKNKPLKPKPYVLGGLDSDEEINNKWGVKLRHIPKHDLPSPIWRSTVTVRNSYDNFRGYHSSNEESNNSKPEFQSLLKNLRPVVNKNLSDSDSRAVEKETKGYSTKVNIGNGEATVIENDKHPTWPTRRDSTSQSKNSRNVLNKGLVVRIGREDSLNNHTLCSKMTSTENTNFKTTTTTKITIDLSPSPPINNKFNSQNQLSNSTKNVDRSQDFKSTSLIMNALKDNNTSSSSSSSGKTVAIKQLEDLKRLYEDVQSDSSEADKEVQQLLMGDVSVTEDDLQRIENDNSSIVSGSWSKMTAYKAVNDIVRKRSVNESNKSVCCSSSKIEKGTATNFSRIRLENDNKPTYKLSSPQLSSRKTPTPTKSFTSSPLLSRKLPVTTKKEFKTIPDNKLQSKTGNMVLRQPKRSEMTYFGVKVSPGPEKKALPEEAVKMSSSTLSNNKPDLLLHDNIRTKPQISRSTKPSRYGKRVSSPVSSNAIYENLPVGGLAKNTFTESKYGVKREFDSKILDELTKAADQILEAVNDFHKDDPAPVKASKPLETIAENSKTSKGNRRTTTSNPISKTKVNRTSSASSVESVRLRRKPSDEPDVFKRLSSSPKPSDRQPVQKKKIGDSASVKARRLQRASSREALLQSHGSSSEDLALPVVEPPVRKPRLKKVTKTTQFSMTNGLDIKKSPASTLKDKERDKSRDRKDKKELITTLPEIRHKTAISTIKSTAEKNRRTRDRSKTGNDVKKRSSSSHRRESSSKGSSNRVMDKENKTLLKNSGAKETIHRISTANIKRCPRSETKT